MIRSLLVATSFFALSGCGTLVTLGEPCTTRADCPPSNSCFLKAPSGTVDVPGGFCSTGCLSEGSTRECPGGTICTFFGDSNLICAPTCTTDAQCRAEYVCADLAMGSSAAGNMSGSKKSCRPKGVTR